jgi:hypothetical protein
MTPTTISTLMVSPDHAEVHYYTAGHIALYLQLPLELL